MGAIALFLTAVVIGIGIPKRVGRGGNSRAGDRCQGEVGRVRGFARILGVDPTQVAALQLLAGGPGLANQLVHDYLVQLRQRGLASATINRYH
jgi:hypothetical protein